MRLFTMNDILPRLGISPPAAGRRSFYIACPCCDKGREKHLNIDVVKDVFRCPRCGFAGGVFDLYAHYTQTDREHVRDELMRVCQGQMPSREVCGKAETEPPLPAECPITDIRVRDATYRALLSKLTLAPDHMANLLGRGLSDKVIVQNLYRTTPVLGEKALAKLLRAEGLYVAGVPGFYRDDDGDWTLVASQRGILIPVRNQEGLIAGLQIRRDNVKRRKFRWLSSCERNDGCGAKGCIHIAGPVRERMLLIEGPIKADVVHHLTGQSLIAVPGVNALTQLEPALCELRELGLRSVMTCFDMDFIANHYVQNGYTALTVLLDNCSLRYGTYLWNPDYNGLDDYVWKYLMNDMLESTA